MKVLSLFSGCGGLDIAFEEQGFELVCAIDHDKAAVDTYNLNLNPVARQADVTNVDFIDTLRHFGSVDVVVGGFPCQGFSKAGPKKVDDPRNSLYKAMVHAVDVLRPRIFVGENVDGLNQNFSGTVLSQIKNDFNKLGYKIYDKTFNAVGFGVPQHRRRTFIIGCSEDINWEWMKYGHLFQTRNGERRIEDPLIDFSDRKPVVTISQSIHDLVSLNANFHDHEISKVKERDKLIATKIGSGQKLCNVRFASTSVYTWQIPEVFGDVSGKDRLILETIAQHRRKKVYGSIPNGNPLPAEEIERLAGKNFDDDDFARLVEKNYLKRIDDRYDLKGAMFCSGLYKRPNWDEPSPTVLTNFDNPRYFLHPHEDRPFSVRECARLQSFPDSFRFTGSVRDKYRQIGNAVPPRMARELAKAVGSALFGSNPQSLAS